MLAKNSEIHVIWDFQTGVALLLWRQFIFLTLCCIVIADLGQAGVYLGQREQGGGPGGGRGDMNMQPEELQAQLISLKQQQHLQQQMLLQKFHEQQVRLAAEHEKQIQEHVKVTYQIYQLAVITSSALSC